MRLNSSSGYRFFPALRAFAVNALLLGAISIIFCTLPLFNEFAFDFSAVICLPLSICSGVMGLALLAKARAASREKTGGINLWLSVHLHALILASVPLGIALLNMARVPACEPVRGLVYYLILPLPSSLFGASLGLLSGSIAKRVSRGILLFSFFCALLIGYSLLKVAYSPAVYSFNPLFGYFPGPVYDHETVITSPLLLSRFLTLFSLIPLGILSSMFRKRETAQTRSFIPEKLRERIVLAISMLTLFSAWLLRYPLHLETGFAYHNRIMSGIITTEHFDIRYEPGTMDDWEVDWLAAEHEFRHGQLADFLGIDETPRFTTYIYSSPDRKKFLMGAGHTQMEDPINLSVHLNPSSFPHSMLKHEIAHLFTAEFGLPVLGISLSPGLLEGIAVAADWPEGGGTPHIMASSLLESGGDFSADRLISPLSFWTGSGSRNYNLAGSFVRFLIDSYGMDKLRMAYPAASFKKAYGVSLDILDRDWKEFLETITPDSFTVAGNVERMRAPSIFEQTCARFKASMTARARRALESGNRATAITLCSEILDRDPEYVPAAVLAAEILTEEGNWEGALAILEPLEERLSSSIAGRRYFLRQTGELHWFNGEEHEARILFTELAMMGSAPYASAGGLLRLACLELSPDRKNLAARLLTGHTASTDESGGDELEEVLQATAALDGREWPLSYIAGKLMFEANRFGRAVELMQDLYVDESIPSDVLRIEILQVLGKALFLEGRFDESGTVFMQIADLGGGAAIEVGDWLQRIRWYSTNVTLTRSGDRIRPVSAHSDDS